MSSGISTLPDTSTGHHLGVGCLPDQLSSAAHIYVAVSGLNVANLSLHKQIWDVLSAPRKQDQHLPLFYKTVSEATDFPKAKPKKSAAEILVPKGILKRNWLFKHLNLVPAVVVLFVELDWSSTEWNEKKLACASKIETIRQNVERRNTRIAVVLIQKEPSLPPGQDVIASERATELCSACDLSPKSLFVLPVIEQQLLEQAFYELSQSYYQNELRRVKSKKDYLNKDKVAHQPLLVRYQFKLAFFNEVKQDSQTALKHYKQAYVHLMDIRWQSFHSLELTTVAGFLNYKICKLCFEHNTPLDAISQFKKHIEFYKGKEWTLAVLLNFEFSAWLAKQCEIFADLFELAVQKGLAAIQTQHPGFYYQSAATQLQVRRSQVEAALSVVMGRSDWAKMRTGSALPAQNGDVSAAPVKSEFFGQRPWRVGLTNCGIVETLTALVPPGQAVGGGMGSTQSMDPRELQAAIRVVEAEYVNREPLDKSIMLLTAAMNNFKRYRSPRMKRFSMVQLGQTFAMQGEYVKALQYLNHVIWEYRQERWFLPLRNVLFFALRCAYCVANVKEYISVSLELLGPQWMAKIAAKDRQFIHTNLQRVFSGQTPESPKSGQNDFTLPAVNDAAMRQAEQRWVHQFTEKSFLMVQMQPLTAGIEAKSSFMPCPGGSDDNGSFLAIPDIVTVQSESQCGQTSKSGANNELNLVVFVRSWFPFPLHCSKLSLQFNNEAYNKYCVLTDVAGRSESNLTLESCETKIFRFKFFPFPDDVGKDVEISSLNIDIGQLSSNVYITLRWDGGSSKLLPWAVPEYLVARQLKDKFDAVIPRSCVNIAPKNAQLDLKVEHPGHALLGEASCINLEIVSSEDGVISNVRLMAHVLQADSQGQQIKSTALLAINCDSVSVATVQWQEIIEHNRDSLSPGEKFKCDVFVRQMQMASTRVRFDVQYDVMVVVHKHHNFVCHCSSVKEIEISILLPFSLQTGLLSCVLDPIDRLVIGEDSLIQIDVKCLAETALKIKSVRWNLEPFLRPRKASNNDDGALLPAELNHNDVFSYTCPILPQNIVSDPRSCGTILIEWWRGQKNSALPDHLNSTSELVLNLSNVTVEHCPILVDVKLPPSGFTRRPLLALYTMTNLTDSVIQFDALMETSEAFMFAGQKQTTVRLLPNGQMCLKFQLLPIMPGQILVPRLKLTSSYYPQDVLDSLSQRNVAKFIFVLPYQVGPSTEE